MKYSLLMIVALGLVMTCSAATYYISPTGDDANPGTEAQPFQTIQKGLESATDGDTVRLLEGVYENYSTFSNLYSLSMHFFGTKADGTYFNGIKILGEGPHKTVLRYTDNPGRSRYIRVSGHDVEIGGFKLELPALADAGYDCGFHLFLATNSFIHDVWIEMPAGSVQNCGVQVQYGNGNWMNVISNVLVDGGSAGIKNRYWAPGAAYAQKTRIYSSTFVNQASATNNNDNPGAGVYVQENHDTIIDKCIMYNTQFEALNFKTAIGYGATQTIENCVWYDCAGFIKDRAGNTVFALNNNVNDDPQFVTINNCPYVASGDYAGYGFIMIPEPAAIGGLSLLGLFLLRRFRG